MNTYCTYTEKTVMIRVIITVYRILISLDKRFEICDPIGLDTSNQ